MSAQFDPISEALGLEVTGMTTRELVSPCGARATQAALDRHGVVVYREINISDEELLELSRMLGTPVIQPTGEHGHRDTLVLTYRAGGFQDAGSSALR